MCRCIPIIWFLLWSAGLSGQQYYHAILHNSGSNRSIYLQNDTKLYDAKVFSTFAELFRIRENEEGALEFSFAQISNTDDVHVRLVGEDPSTLYFGFHFMNGQVYIEDAVGTLPLGGQNIATHDFAIVRCQNTITYLFDNAILLQRELDDMNFSLTNELSTEAAQAAEINLAFFETDAGSCDWPFYMKDREAYFDLTQEFTNRYLVISDDILKLNTHKNIRCLRAPMI